MVATFLGSLTIWALFTGPVFSPVFDRPRPLFFLFSGAVISLVMERIRRGNAKLEAANHELSARTEALAKSNEELERFAYALSHDLQTPLRNVGMFTERLAANLNPADEDTATSLRFISEGVASMQAMIRGLLDYATASKHAPAAVQTNLNEVVAIVLRDLHSEIERCGAQVTMDPLPTIPADETRIRQVFQNLISNAIKYSGGRRPEIHVGAKSAAKDWIFCVRDNGIGIDMRYADKIFGLFERLNKDSSGTGIGLAVSRAIIERHGGRIWVQSEVGKGSTFYFTLPKPSKG
jgi:light-regulated signal transduction histidine kinase (bacteriophytochrome)